MWFKAMVAAALLFSACVPRTPAEGGEGEGEGEGETADCVDADNDGFCTEFDRDDADATTSFGTEVPDNGLDDNGDGRIDEDQVCNTSDDCSNDRHTCYDRNCLYADPRPTRCTVDDDCPESTVCMGGVCAQPLACRQHSECPSTQWCRSEVCTPTVAMCFSSADCEGGTACVAGACVSDEPAPGP